MIYSISLANFFGYLSLVSWLVVFVPQAFTNYCKKDASSLSINFVLFWLFGDSLNLLGVVLGGLETTTLMLGIYFLFADCFMLFQIWLYCNPQTDIPSDTSPLLQKKKSRKDGMKNKIFISLSTVFILVILAYFLSTVFGKQVVGAGLGWTACALFWSARIPQLIKNHRRRSVEGLSIIMFLCCVLGNLSFSCSVLVHPKAVDPRYLFQNLPWLMGSGGTVVVDFLVFLQFYLYGGKRNEGVPFEVARADPNIIMA